MNIKVYDEIMGSGKTTRAIQRINEYIEKDEKFIYVTPFLTEVKRIIEATGHRAFAPLSKEEEGSLKFSIEDNLIDENGVIDLNAEKSFNILNKREQFIRLVLEGKCIVTTHQLFTKLPPSDYKMLNDYILILDEVITPIYNYKIGAQDIKIMQEQNLIHIDSNTSLVTFVSDDYNDPAFHSTKNLCLPKTFLNVFEVL